MTTVHTDVAIVGGGVAGLALAARLRVAGRDCRVVERSHPGELQGIGIVLVRSGLDQLEALGVLDEVRSRGRSAFGVVTTTTDGAVLEERTIEEHLCIRRSDLVEILAGRLGTGTISFGVEATGVDVDDVRIRALLLSDGTRVEAGLFVGADGTHSMLRSWLHPSPEQHPDLVRACLSVSQAPDVVRRLDGRLLKIELEGLVVGAAALSDDEVLWYLTYSTRHFEPDDRDARSLAAFAESIAGDWAAPLPELIRHTDFARSRVCRTPDIDVPARMWVRNSVLIGDAAHPLHFLTSQGANTALEDAATLAGLLGQPGSSRPIEDVLTRYEQVRRPVAQDRVREGRERAREIQASVLPPPPGATTMSDEARGTPRGSA